MARPESSAAAGAGAAGSARDSAGDPASGWDAARFPGGLLRSLSLRGSSAGSPLGAGGAANAWGWPRWALICGLAATALAVYWTWPESEIEMAPLYADSTTMTQEEATDVLNALFEKRVEAQRLPNGQILVPKGNRDKSLRFLAERGLGPVTTEAIRRGGEQDSIFGTPSSQRAKSRHLLERQAEKAIAATLPVSASTVHFSTGKSLRPTLGGKTDSAYVRVVLKTKAPLEEHEVDRIGEILTSINPDVAPADTTVFDDRGWSYSLTRDRHEQALRRRIWAELRSQGIVAQQVLVQKEGSIPFPSRSADLLVQRASATPPAPASATPATPVPAPAERALINKPMRLPDAAPAALEVAAAEPGPLALEPSRLRITVTVARSGQHAKLLDQAKKSTEKIVPPDQLEALELTIADTGESPNATTEPQSAAPGSTQTQSPTPTQTQSPAQPRSSSQSQPPVVPASSGSASASASDESDSLSNAASSRAPQTKLRRYAPTLAIGAALALVLVGYAARRGLLTGAMSPTSTRGRTSSAAGARANNSPAGSSRIIDRWDEEAA